MTLLHLTATPWFEDSSLNEIPITVPTFQQQAELEQRTTLCVARRVRFRRLILVSKSLNLLEDCPGSTTNTEFDALKEFPSLSLPLTLFAVSDSRGWQEFCNEYKKSENNCIEASIMMDTG